MPTKLGPLQRARAPEPARIAAVPEPAPAR